MQIRRLLAVLLAAVMYGIDTCSLQKQQQHT